MITIIAKDFHQQEFQIDILRWTDETFYAQTSKGQILKEGFTTAEEAITWAYHILPNVFS
jgi:hypothetical protein